MTDDGQYTDLTSSQITTGLFLAGCLLITAIQLVTDPITCDVKGVPGGIFNAYCWTHSTFSLPARRGQPHPGVGEDQGDQVSPTEPDPAA